jgi:hypothetical protein
VSWHREEKENDITYDKAKIVHVPNLAALETFVNADGFNWVRCKLVGPHHKSWMLASFFSFAQILTPQIQKKITTLKSPVHIRFGDPET